MILLIGAAVDSNAEPRRCDTVALREPLDIPLMLSGNFGELRRNHFHSGVDFKTQGKTGLPVFAADDGYVSRASVSPWGFGRAVYITHPATGLTTVYGHLEAFAPNIDKLVRQAQYDAETFSIDMTFDPGQLPVKKGDVIARSGNAGSSGGPHLHFDVRDTDTEDPLDPLEFFHKQVKDNVPPEVRLLALYPVDGGVVDGKTNRAAFRQPQAQPTFTAWGQVVPGIKAYDRMTGTSNIYGVKYLTLLLDNDTIYHRVIDRYSFDDTRAIHTIVDNDELIASGAWIMTTRIADAQPLPYMITGKNKGIVDIDEERDYKFKWILGDEHGNKTTKEFTVKGEKSLYDANVAKGHLASWNTDNLLQIQDIEIEIPARALYDNTFIEVSSEPNDTYYSAKYRIGELATPLAHAYTVTLPLVTDTIVNKAQYCLIAIDGKKVSAKPSRYDNGKIVANLSNFGTFAVTADKKPPLIEPLAKDRWRSTGIIKFKITDNLSGVEKWRGEIDGHFALFELDGKTATLWFKIDPDRFPGKNHQVNLTVTDACGNESRYEAKI